MKEQNNLPLVSIMIATFNSERILRKPLEAIKKQSYPRDKIEIIIIDGGSTDNTIEIAKEYNCVVLNNPKTDPVSAKVIGIREARGRYLITIDHDEVLTNPDSILIRVDAMSKHNECKVAFCSGYKFPNGYSGLNEYISEFGDPFSLFYYRFSKGYRFYIKALNERASLIEKCDKYCIHRFDKTTDRVIIEIICLATMIDLQYFRGLVSDEQMPDAITHLFNVMLENGENCTIITNNDPLEHYSVDSIKRYLPKLRWRIVNNVHYAERAKQGFYGRLERSKGAGIRKYIFPLYSLSVIFPLIDGGYYSITRNNIAFMLHPFLCLYVTFYIFYQYYRKLIGSVPDLENYDGSKIMNK